MILTKKSISSYSCNKIHCVHLQQSSISKMGVDYEQGITKIEKLDELVYEHISKDKRIINIKITPLTEPGENFGSTILKLDLTLDSSTNSTELLSIVAKMIPTDEFFQQLFNIKLTFRLESAFYEIIVPTLQNFQRECGVQNVIDFFPQFYGARMNLVGGDDVDCNAVLLLENLKVSGKQLKIIHCYI